MKETLSAKEVKFVLVIIFLTLVSVCQYYQIELDKKCINRCQEHSRSLARKLHSFCKIYMPSEAWRYE